MQPRTAALLLLATAMGGRILLSWRRAPHDAPGAVAFHLGDRTGLAQQRGAALVRSAEVGEGERIDIDRATAGELARLPGVGPSLARRVVAERTAHGAFGGPACLDARVAGIGPGFLKRAGAHLDFSGPECVVGGHGGNGGTGGTAPTAPADSTVPTTPALVDLNTATRAQLEGLPGIGPARAESILALRGRRGGFRSLEELRALHGLSAGLLKGLEGRVRLGPVP